MSYASKLIYTISIVAVFGICGCVSQQGISTNACGDVELALHSQAIHPTYWWVYLAATEDVDVYEDLETQCDRLIARSNK